MLHLRTIRNTASIAFNALATVISIVALVGFAVFAIGPHTGAYRTLSILSGSMTPAFAPGDVVIDTPLQGEDLRVGQVITYQAPTGGNEVVSHRVIEIVKAGDRPTFRTKGDANPAADPWTAKMNDDRLWRQRLVIPRAGHVIGALRRSAASRNGAFVALALLVLMGLRSIWSKDTPAADAAEKPGPSSDVSPAPASSALSAEPTRDAAPASDPKPVAVGAA